MTTPTLTIDDIAALRALAEKATPGPWRQHLVDDTTIIDATGEFVASTFPEGGMDDDIDYATDTEQREHSAAFIAAAANTLPAALDEIERLRAENASLREECEITMKTIADNYAEIERLDRAMVAASPIAAKEDSQ